MKLLNSLNLDSKSNIDDLFWTVFRTSTNLMSITDAECKSHLAVNDAWLSTLKYSIEESIGETVLDLKVWPEKHYPQKIMECLKNEGSFENMEIVMQAKDGTQIHCLLTAQPIRIDDQKLILFSCHDVTSKKLVDEALLSAREMFIDALESINEGFVLYGPGGGLIICNSKFREFYGYSEEEASYGTHRKYLGHLDIERQTVVIAHEKAENYINRRENINAGPPKAFEVKLKDDRILILSDRTTSHGGIVSIQSDITNQRTVEAALRRSQKMDAIGQLMGGIAHDFNNILSIIIGNLELAEEITDRNSETENYIHSAIKGAHRGADITKKILSFSRQKNTSSHHISANELLKNMEGLIAKSLTASVQIELNLSDDLWDLEANPGDLEDAILNLSLNARDALLGSGTLSVATQNCVLVDEFTNHNSPPTFRDYVQISVTDTGAGIADDIKEKIFEPFFTTKEVGKGTGLGLSMVYGFIQRSEGQIKVKSQLGKGTTICLYLPRSKTSIKAKSETLKKRDNPRGSETILVVDDEAPLIHIAATILGTLGYKVLTAINGVEALERLESNPSIDLMFTDVIMPGGIDGFQLSLRAKEINPEIKILLASGFTQMRENLISQYNDEIQKLSENLLQKPYSKSKLAASVRELLDEVTVPDEI
ncbi:MAG: PAS domain S-box protein [Sneathiella sp.]|nr:PAS domain S-box protein [Sneathiella sp.]